MQCFSCKKETDEKASGLCAHCGNPLGTGKYAPPDGFAFDPISGKYYKTESRFDPHSGTPITKVLWFDAQSGQYQVACSDEGVLITPQPEMPAAPPAMCKQPLSAPPLPTTPLAMHGEPIHAPPLPATKMPMVQKPFKQKKQHGKMAAIIVSLVMVVAIGGAGFGAWKLGMLDNILSKPGSVSSSMPEQSELDTVIEDLPESSASQQTEPSASAPEDITGKFLIIAEDVIDREKGQIFTSPNDAIANTKDGGRIQLSGDVQVGLSEAIHLERGIQLEVVNDAELTVKGTVFVLDGSILRLNNGKIILMSTDDADVVLHVENAVVQIYNKSSMELATDKASVKMVDSRWEGDGFGSVQTGLYKLSDNKLVEATNSIAHDGMLQPYYGFLSDSTMLRVAIHDAESFTMYVDYAGSGTQIDGLYSIEKEHELVFTPHDGIFNPLTTEKQMRFLIRGDGSLELLFPNLLGDMQAGIHALAVGEQMPGVEQGHRLEGIQFGFPFVGIYEQSGEGSETSPVTLYLQDNWKFFLVFNRSDGTEEQMSGKLEWSAEELCLRLVPDGFIDKMFDNREVVLRGQMTSDRQEMFLTVEKGDEFVGSFEYRLFNVD